jgi:pseudouridine-5'-phosphate glycosidase
MVLPVRVSTGVAGALVASRPVVALESTIFSTLGLPPPANAEALDRCQRAIEGAGAVPALTCVLGGEARVGVDAHEVAEVLAATRKVAERDLGVAVAQGWDAGATTVSATLALTDAAGIAVFATGGIGGVHRGVESSGDVSSDLGAIARHPVVTVCAGAKAFLDLGRTLELLETLGVPVLGWRHERFPAFYTRDSGFAVPHRVETAVEVAEVLRARPRPETGVLLAVPIPGADELDAEVLDGRLRSALDAAERSGLRGADVTPFVLSQIADLTEGDSIAANLALAENNARVAAEVAVALAGLGGR